MTTNAAAAAAKAPEFQTLPLEKVRLSKSNPRRHIDKDDLKDLAASIRAQGILEPPIVRPVQPIGAYELVVGERRYRAAKLAGLTETTFKIQPMSDSEALEAQLVENLQRQDVSALDEGLGYKALLAMPTDAPEFESRPGSTVLHRKTKYDVKAIAERVGKSPGYVYARVKLADLQPLAAEALQEGVITAGHAVLIARLQPADQERALRVTLVSEGYASEPAKDDKTADLLKDRVLDGLQPLPEKDLREWIRENTFKDLARAPFDTADPNVIMLAGSCTACPKRSGNIPAEKGEFDKPNLCTDAVCYGEKVKAHLADKQTIARATGATLFKLSENRTYRPAKEGAKVLRRGQWEDAKAGSCPDVQKGIITAGEDLGKTKTVCTNVKCKVHPRHGFTSRSSAEQQDRASTPDRKAEAKRRLERAIEEHVLIEIGKAAVGKVSALGTPELRRIAEILGDNADPQNALITLGRNESTNLRDVIKKAGPAELVRVTVALLLTDDNYYAGSWRDRYASERKIDVKALRRAVEAKTKRACFFCGCTEITPCEDGDDKPCAWVPQGAPATNLHPDVCNSKKCCDAAMAEQTTKAGQAALRKLSQRRLPLSTSAKPKPRAKVKRAKPRAIAKPKTKAKSKAKPKSKARR